MSLDTLTANDAPGVHAPSLYADRRWPDPRPALTGEADADVAIVGGGLTGCSAALHCAERGMKAVVLEANRVGWGASGRNGGQLGTEQHRTQAEIEDWLGEAHARHLHALAVEANELVRGFVAERGIDAGLTEGILYVNHRKRFGEESRRHVERMRERYGVQSLRHVPPEALREMLASDAFHDAILDMRAAHLNPMALVQGLADAAEGAGATIHEQSRVTAVEEGRGVTVRTASGGTLRARRLLFALNGYHGDLVPSLGRAVMPINNFVVATEPLGEEQANALIKDRLAVCDSRFVVNYFRIDPDTRLIFGGAESYGMRFPKDIAKTVRPALTRTFPQLRKVAITHAWGGTLGITRSRLPHFARISANVLTCGGYSGHGVGLATLGGKLAAEAFDGEPERFDVFARIPASRFPGGRRARGPLLAGAMVWYGLRDRV